VLCAPTADALGTALAEVLLSPAAFAPLGAAARRRVRERYSPEAFARKLLAAYGGLLDGTLSRAADRAGAQPPETRSSSASSM
jgi:glycosyltransferase involved in cell wall biosynthesis